ncbi:MAG TPA: PEGA domain-containing protein [Polyangiaceae bacterium]|nr:PEGA domain-containing protein [Polyangiaceae bacterium]
MGAFGLPNCVPAPARTVSMRMHGADSDAIVHIDDQYLGTFSIVEARGVALPPGQHRISVEKPGYFPWDRLVDVKEGDPLLRLEVELKKIPD